MSNDSFLVNLHNFDSETRLCHVNFRVKLISGVVITNLCIFSLLFAKNDRN
jgi:hypothetical protein